MKIDEILTYDRDHHLMRRIGDAFLPNGQLKLPLDFAGLVSDPESMLDQTVDRVPDDIMDVASSTLDQRPRPIGGVAPTKGPGSSDLPAISRNATVAV
jgi:hypothetical protein